MKKEGLVTIDCITTDKEGVIQSMNVTISGNGKESIKEEDITKDDLIQAIKEAKNNDIELKIETSEGTKVHIVNDEYLRTDGDENKENDLVDSPICE